MYSKYFKIAVVIVVLGLLLSGCRRLGVEQLRGNGQMVDEVFTFNGLITKIDVTGVPADFIITSENSGNVTYVIDSNLIDYVEITHRNGVLSISTADNISISNSGIVFNIRSAALSEINITGAGNVKGNDDISAETLKISITGAGSAELSGAVEKLELNGDGAVQFNMRNLAAEDVVINLNGAGSAQVRAERTLDISVAGAVSVVYWGNPGITQSVAGLSNIVRGE